MEWILANWPLVMGVLGFMGMLVRFVGPVVQEVAKWWLIEQLKEKRRKPRKRRKRSAGRATPRAGVRAQTQS